MSEKLAEGAGQSSKLLESSHNSSNSLQSQQSHRSRYDESPRDFDDVGNADFTEDGDVIERIRSRASVKSDLKQLITLREKYKEGFYRLDPADPRDPHNWSLRRKTLHQFFYGIAILLPFACASIFSPLVNVVTPHGTEVGTLAFSIFMIGYALGPIIFSPFCSIFGRLVSTFTPLFVAGVFMCICANLDYTGALVVYRFLAGVMASGPACSLRGASADIWLDPTAQGKAHEVAMIWSSFSAILGSAGAPIFGALLVETGSYGWRWSCWLVGLLSLVVSFLCLLFLKETYHPIIEQKAAKEERLDSGFWGLHSEHDSYHFTLHDLSWDTFRDSLILLNPIAWFSVTFASFNYGVLYLLVTAAPYEMQMIYPNMTFRASYATLLAIPVGFLVCSWGNIGLAKPRRTREWITRMHPSSSGVSDVSIKPESQLRALVALGWLFPASMFMFGWSLYSNVHWIVPVVGMALFGGAVSVNIRGCHFYLHDVYPGYFQLTSGACIVMQSIFAGVFPLFARQLFNNMNIHWGSSLIAFIALALYLPMCLFLILGHKIRRYDIFATTS